MKGFIRAVTAIGLLIATTVGVAWSQGSVEISAADHDIATDNGIPLYFVELSTPPTEDGGQIGTILAEQASFRTQATQNGVAFTERSAYQKLWNGLTIAVQESDLSKLRAISSVASIQPVLLFSLPDEPPVNETELLTALTMTGADVAQNSLGLTGTGIKVGVIDTGIDYDHPDLGGDGVNRVNSTMFPNGRVVGGTDLVGDAFDGSNTPVPDPYPDDGCNGHGTHVAGIVGANGGARGVAPGVSLYAYKVFGCFNTTSSDAMLAAMELALADNVDVINMSIGAAFQWPSYPTAKAATRLVNKGIVVVCSQGNNGGNGLGAGSAPGVGAKVIGVASYDNTFINSGAFTASPDNRVINYNPGIDAPITPTSGTFPLARTGTAASLADACSPLAAGSLAGKVALIRRGTCSFYIKATNAKNAGAVAVVLYNNAAGGITPILTPPTGQPAITIPVVAITAADGALLDARLASGPVDITWTTGSSTPNATGGFISGFSSIGLSPDLVIKPDIGAPGGFIRSTVPLNQGAYGQNSGTSMSSPHVAGAAALVLEALPNTPSNAMRDILQNSANPRPFSAAIPFLDMVARQGAGLLNIPSAVLANTRIEPGKLSLGETEGAAVTQTLSIKNNSNHTISYSLYHQPALAAGPNTFVVSLFNAPSTVSFSANPVVVPAGGSANVNVTVGANPGLADFSVFGGYVQVIPDDGGADYTVPFSGFKGDYQGRPAVTPTPSGFPWLAKQVGASFVNQPGGATYTLQAGDIPIILLHLDTPVSRLRFEIIDAVSGQSFHRALDERDFRRSTGATSFFAFGWDGVTFHGPGNKPKHLSEVPNGQYVLKLTALRPLGSESNPAHVDTWLSPVITIARPDLVVEGIGVSQPVVNANDQVTLTTIVRNAGVEPQSGVHVEFLDNAVLLGAVDIDIAAGASQVAEIPWTVGPETQHNLQVKVRPLDSELSVTNNQMDLRVTLGESIVGVGGPNPRILSFAGSKPNPFNGSVAFRFSLPEAGPVALDVFDLAGRRLKTWRWNSLGPGDHSINWDGRTEAGRSAPAGTLLLRLTAMGRTLTQKAVRIH
jgi:minor extracellular serine protease Vpr